MATGKKPESAAARVLSTRRNWPPAPKGHKRSLKHGTSKAALGLAPIRERHLAELTRDYPHLDARRQVLLADRLARLEAAMAWLDRVGIVRNTKGDPQPILRNVEIWASRAESLLREAEHEQQHRPKADFALEASSVEEDGADES